MHIITINLHQHLPITYIICFYYLSSAAQLHPNIHKIPEGTESVNGSRADGGCMGNVTHHYCGNSRESFLTDGVNQVINTTDPNWASELVTVRKNNVTWNIQYDHVLLVFVFNSKVSLKSIRLNLFQCPQWGIGAPNIAVYAKNSQSGDFVNFYLEKHDTVVLAQLQDVQSSCNDLVPVTIPLETYTQYNTWYIVVSFEPQPDIDWVYMGEVQFFDTLPQPPPLASRPSIKPQPPPSTSTKPTNLSTRKKH